MAADVHEIAETLRAVAAGELALNEAQTRAVAEVCAELSAALAAAPEPRLLSDRDVASLPYTVWHREVRSGALNALRSLAGRPPELPAAVDDLNAEARRNLAAARELYDSFSDRI